MAADSAPTSQPSSSSSSGSAPYAQFSHLLAVANSGSVRAGEPIDLTIQAVLSSGSSRSEVRGALGALGFVDDRNHPTTLFLRFVRDEASRPELLTRVLQERYGDAVSALEAGADRGSLEELLASPGRSAQTRSRAVSFFLSAAEHAGMDVSRARRRRKSGPSGTVEDQTPAHGANDGGRSEYGELLLRAMGHILSEAKVTDDVTFERFVALGDRYERWMAGGTS